MNKNTTSIAFQTAATYAGIGFLWIFFSDTFITSLTTSIELINTMQMYKGLFFVTATAGILFIVLQQRLQAVERERSKRLLTETKLNVTEESYRVTMDTMLEGCQILDFDWKYRYLNKTAEQHNRRSNEELLGQQYHDKWPGIESTAVYSKLKRCMEERTYLQFETEFTFSDGTQRWFDLRVQPVPEGIFILSIDITDRIRADEKLRNMNRVYAVLSNINQLIVHTKDIQTVFQQACSIAVGDGKFVMAWIGIRNDTTNTLEVVASAGVAEDYLKNINIDFNDEHRSSGPTGMTVRTGMHHFTTDIETDPTMFPWRKDAVRLGYKSSAALPLHLKGKVIGALTLYAGEKNFFTANELELLDELAQDISFAMEVHEIEEERQRTYDALQESELIFSQFMEHSPVYVFFKDDQMRSLRLSRNFETMLGRPVKELLGKSMDELFPSDLAKTMIADDKRILKEGKQVDIEERLNGRIYNTIKFPIHYKGEARYLAGFTVDITDQKLKEKQLLESEKRYRTIVENVRQAYCESDRRSLFTYCNPGLLIISGYSEDELLGVSSFRLVAEEHRASVAAQYRQWVLERRDDASMEFIVVKKNGEQLWVEQSSHFDYDPQGRIVKATNFLRDINERKIAEKAIRLRESYLSAIVENQQGRVWLKDIEGRYLTVNHVYAAACGKTSPAELTGLTDLDMWPKELAEKYQSDDANIMISRSAIVVEERSMFRGAEKWFETYKAPVIDEQGIVIGTTGFSHDITERKIADEMIKESETRFKMLFEKANDAILIMHNGVFIDCNPKSEKMFGCRKEEIVGRSPLAFSPAVQPKGNLSSTLAAEKIQKTMNDQPQFFEWKHLRYDGILFDAEVSLNKFEIGEASYIQAIVRNVTERKKAEEQIEMLAQALRSICECVSVTDVKDNIIFVNKAFCSTYGYEENEVLGKNISMLRSPVNDSTLISGILPKTEEGGWHGELVNRKKTGEDFFIELSTSVVRNAFGEGVAMIGVAQDITVRKHIERIMLENEIKLKNIIENSTNVFYSHDCNHVIHFISPQIKNLLGYEVEEALVEWMTLATDNPVNNAGFERTVRAIETGKPQGSYELELRHKDGRFIWVEVHEAPVVENGVTISIVGSLNDITERKRAEDNLRENEERLRLSLAAANQGLFDLDVQTGNAIVNNEYATMLGYDPESFVETNDFWIERLHPDDKARAAQTYTDYVNGKLEEYRLEFRQKTASGKWKWILSIGKIIELTPDGKPKRMLGTHTDIDDMKRSEEIQMLQTTALESAANGIVITDLEGHIVWVNNAFARITGYSQKETIGATPSLLKSGKHTKEFYAQLWDTIRSGETWTGNVINKRKDGTLYDDEMTITPVRNTHNVITHFVAVKQDVTERNKAIQRIKEQAMLLDEAHDAIILRDMKNTVMYWNKGAERLFGWSDGDSVGRDIRDLIYRESNDHEKEMDQLLREGNFSGEFQLQTREKKIIIADVRMNVIYDDEGKPKSILSILEDITEKKKIEIQLLRTQRMGSLGTLAGGIAHDLNNVLAPILLAVEFLKRTYVNETSQKILESVESSARRGSEIVKQILTFARGVETQQILIQPRHLIKEIVTIFKETFPRSITITSDIPNATWPIMGDPTHFHQLIMNLGVNARDAMPDGGTLSITASNVEIDEQYTRMNIDAKIGRYVMFTIRDTGVGMSPQTLDHIFEPFFTTKEIGKGTGLGLSTVYTIVKSHKGFIKVISEVNKGTIFNVYLPASETTASETSEKKEHQDYFGSGELILIVDDEASVREVTKHTLEGYNYSVVTAADGAEGVARFAEQRDKIVLVLTDMMMPLMDGHHLIITLRKIKPSLKIIATSGLIDASKKLEGDNLSIDGYIDKPFTAEKLLSLISSVLKGKQ
ncbi:MAG: PAS domain S-box protein [Bacteroidota bacterium]